MQKALGAFYGFSMGSQERISSMEDSNLFPSWRGHFSLLMASGLEGIGVVTGDDLGVHRHHPGRRWH